MRQGTAAGQPTHQVIKSLEGNISRWSHTVDDITLSAPFSPARASPVKMGSISGSPTQSQADSKPSPSSTRSLRTSAERPPADRAGALISRLRPPSPASPPGPRQRGEDFYLAASVLTISRPSNASSPAASSPASSPLASARAPPPPQRAARALPLAEDPQAGAGEAESLVPGPDGEPVDARPIERLILQQVEAIEHCMLVTHPSAPGEIGCLITLRAAGAGAGGGLALHRAGLALADRSGSEATTVMSARQCAMFRAGLAAGLGAINHQIVGTRVQARSPSPRPAPPRPASPQPLLPCKASALLPSTPPPLRPAIRGRTGWRGRLERGGRACGAAMPAAGGSNGRRTACAAARPNAGSEWSRAAGRPSIASASERRCAGDPY